MESFVLGGTWGIFMWLESLVLREEGFYRRKTWVGAEC